MSRVYLTYKGSVNIVQCLNIILHKSPRYAVLSPKLYLKLIEYDLLDDCCFDFHVPKFLNSPNLYSIKL